MAYFGLAVSGPGFPGSIRPRRRCGRRPAWRWRSCCYAAIGLAGDFRRRVFSSARRAAARSRKPSVSRSARRSRRWPDLADQSLVTRPRDLRNAARRRKIRPHCLCADRDDQRHHGRRGPGPRQRPRSCEPGRQVDGPLAGGRRGTLIIASVIVLWASEPSRAWSRWGLLETAAVVIVTAAIGAAAFSPQVGSALMDSDFYALLAVPEPACIPGRAAAVVGRACAAIRATLRRRRRFFARLRPGGLRPVST